MRIDINQLNTAESVSETSTKGKSEATSTSAPQEDNATVSSDASAVAKLKEQVLAMPDIRMDKVTDLRQQIHTGKYKMDATATADGILRDLQK